MPELHKPRILVVLFQKITHIPSKIEHTTLLKNYSKNNESCYFINRVTTTILTHFLPKVNIKSFRFFKFMLKYAYDLG